MAHMSKNIRVEWVDVDGGGAAHHSMASIWAERVEHSLLRELQLPPDRFPRRRVEVDFHRALRFGDCFTLSLEIAQVGATSVVYLWFARMCGAVYFSGRTVTVFVDDEGRSRPVPGALRSKVGSPLS